ncbi:hypothetical protein [Oceanihabitans sediminis]|uniref:hypothetical protein n=1 Tax=Oceanihabitans sediminis TaxID=1812012 RepID=UPI00299D5B88|nr:hypothetical protein [Oceanihabitans sediminis]MDX1277622.1 hypothetical protein [Oceanihabitans sediminis]
MLVFPKTYNNRLIIGALVIVIAGLSTFSILNYISFKKQEDFLRQEVLLIQNELVEMMSINEDVTTENKTIENQLEDSKTRIQSVLNYLTETKTDVSLLSHYKNQVQSLKKERELIFSKIDSLVRNNKQLQDQVDASSEQLDIQKSRLSALAAKNNSLSKLVNKVAALKAENVKVSALASSRSMEVIESNTTSNIEHFEVCATLESNEFTAKGNKNIYVQILDSDNHVVSQRGTLKYQGENISYSGKTTIENMPETIKTCLKISIFENEELKPGRFQVHVFQNTTLIGSNSIVLQ